MNAALFWLMMSAAAYVCGSIPFGFLVARYVRGIDLRKVGSGNIGATNASRALGGRWGLVIFALDFAKGALPTAFLPGLPGLDAGGATTAPVVAGVSAILGHVFPVWLNFRGGKGVATSLGVAAVLAPVECAVSAGLFLLLLALTRMVSLSSLIGAAGFAVTYFSRHSHDWSSPGQWCLTGFSTLVPLLLVWLHRANIKRILAGTEARIGQRVTTTPSPTEQSSGP